MLERDFEQLQLLKELRNCHEIKIFCQSHHWLKISNMVGGFETAVMVFCNRQTDGWIGHLSMILWARSGDGGFKKFETETGLPNGL